MNFNYCYKITYESEETYDRRRNELSVEISKEENYSEWENDSGSSGIN